MGAVDKIAKQNRKGLIASLQEPIKPKGGEKIPAAMRKQLEEAFDQDFSEVRLHRDEESEKLIEELGVRAFTQGNHVFMPQGGLKIDTMAHEMCHVVQNKDTPLSGKKVMIAK